MEGTEIEGVGAGDGLETGRLQNLLESIGLGWVGVEICPFLFNRWAVGFKHRFLNGGGEACKTGGAS